MDLRIIAKSDADLEKALQIFLLIPGVSIVFE